ncbi:hypothetical protein [Aurantibacillus circumpalustris]|uniref:hypothetical protein n=1 Tax=Aurantibacillus circumpalustris TaxID=3036359 RepID=UPI00295BB0CC|nr:hypothetical protein [Aurantibacillus circumpalustris]
MNNQKDNSDNKPIKNFLNSSKNDSNAPMDDFDKEAMEGFANLDEEEILDLKTKLDSRAYSEIFITEKKSNMAYWYAAAGLFLVVGFSIYFILNSSLSKREDLALESNSLPKDEIQKTLETQNEKTSSSVLTDELKHNETVSAKKPQEKNAMTFKNNQKEPEAENNKEIRSADQKLVSTADKELPATINESALAVNNVMRVKAVPMVSAPVAADDRYVSKEDLAENKQNKTLEEEEEVASIRAKKKEGLAKTSRTKKDDDAMAAGVSISSADLSNVNTCQYAGGESALIKELNTRLKAKNLLQKFDATLYITAEGKVDKVVYTNSFDLSKEQQSQVTELLKGLDKFKFTNPTSSETLAEYTLVFRP